MRKSVLYLGILLFLSLITCTSNSTMKNGTLNGQTVETREVQTSSGKEVGDNNDRYISGPTSKGRDWESQPNVPMSFMTEQYVYGYLANKSFRHSCGLVIKFNGDCQVYIDGDWVAGTFTVLRYDSMNAYIRFNSPTYGTNHLLAKINGDEIELVDTSDGSVYWQIK